MGKGTAKPSALVDTRVVYCGDCLEKLPGLPDAERQMSCCFTQSGRVIVPLTVKDILEEELARKLA